MTKRTIMSVVGCVALMTLAAAPFGQWYLAWVALAPLLVTISHAPTIRAAAWRGWFAGVLYFGANIWWLWTASIPGTDLIVVIFALYWAVVAGQIRGLRLLASPETKGSGIGAVYGVFAVAVVWVA